MNLIVNWWLSQSERHRKWNKNCSRIVTAMQCLEEKVKDSKGSKHTCVCVRLCGCVMCARVPAHTSATLSSNGSNQWSLHSQWESKKVRTGAVAASAPRTLERISPKVQKTNTVLVTEHKYKRARIKTQRDEKDSSSPSLRSFLNTRTFSILPSSAPSSAETQRKNHTNDPGDTLRATHTSFQVGLLPSLTVVAVVVHQNDLLDQVRRTFL